MASYSDYIRMQDFLPVYDITAEPSNRIWSQFIPTLQFCDLLGRTITAISSADRYKRKSIWVQGTFGTGKSHASSVIRHLLCDEYDSIRGYIQTIEDSSLRAQIDNLRKEKRFFSVVIKGVEGAYDLPRFSLSLQRKVASALKKAGYTDIVVKSDFESAIKYVEEHKKYVQDSIDKCGELRDIASTPEKIIGRLRENDIELYMELEKALMGTVGVPLTTKNISEWLAEMENEIEEREIADGLIIFWDEFTSVMEATNSDRINTLQNIAEKSQQQNLFLFLISHRVEEQVRGSRGQDIRTMNDRFDTVRYTMDEVSTYRIMKHTFTIAEGCDYEKMRYQRTARLNEVLDYLCEGGVVEEKQSILNLFPMHPYSAFLCSKLADYVGSASRSVMNFMNDDKKGFKKFLSDETLYESKSLLTAEWLWDFFYDNFASKPFCSVFISTYLNQKGKVELMGDDFMRVFKGILLLNTLTAQFQSSNSRDVINRLYPSEKSIRGLFADDRVEPRLNEIFEYLDSKKIIPRDPYGDFKISVSVLNPQEVANEKEKVSDQYKVATDFLKLCPTANTEITDLFAVGSRLLRKCNPQIYSCSDQENLVRAKLNKYIHNKVNTLHVAIYLAVSEEECRAYENIVKGFSIEFKDSIHIIPYEVLTEETRDRFIEQLANHNVAKSHSQEDIAKEYRDAALELVRKWVNRLVKGTYVLYFNGEPCREGIVSNIYSLINKTYSVRVFSQGLEAIREFRTVTATFLANANSPTLITQVLQAQTREKLLKFTGQDTPAKRIFMADDTCLVDEQCQLTPAALASDAWLVAICKEVDKCVENAKKKYVDKFTLPEIFATLIHPPYGFFRSRANFVAFAYALRKHKGDLFDTSTSQPVSVEKLSSMIVELFKMWDDGRSEANNKLQLRFGSKEESELTRLLYDIFQLGSIRDIPEIKSLDNLRWGINQFCIQKSKFPLWAITYTEHTSDALSEIVTDMMEVLQSDQNPSIAKIKELYGKLSKEKVDLALLVANPSNFEDGFRNFVRQIDGVSIEPEWWDGLMEEINHLQSEVAYRKESDVRDCVYKFYIAKTRPVPQTPQPAGAYPVTDANPPETGKPTSATPVKQNSPSDSVKRAKDIVKATSMPGTLWQRVVLDIIDGHPEVADFIFNYLS